MYSLCQVWALVVMFLSKKYNRLPHFFTINLFFAQVSTRPHAPQAQLLNISSHFDAVKSFCGCKVTSVNVSLCFLYAFQFLTCIGMIVWSVVAIEEGPTGQIVVFMLLWTSQYSTYMWPGMLCPQCVVHHWTARMCSADLWHACSFSNFHCLGLIALSLVLLRRSEDLNVSPAVFFFAGWGWVSWARN